MLASAMSASLQVALISTFIRSILHWERMRKRCANTYTCRSWLKSILPFASDGCDEYCIILLPFQLKDSRTWLPSQQTRHRESKLKHVLKIKRVSGIQLILDRTRYERLRPSNHDMQSTHFHLKRQHQLSFILLLPKRLRPHIFSIFYFQRISVTHAYKHHVTRVCLSLIRY